MFDRVIWLSGMPRSGTTWLSQVFSSHPEVRLKYDPLFSYEFKNALDFNSMKDDWQSLFEASYETKGDFLDQNFLRRDGLVPEFTNRADKPSVLAIKSNRHHALIADAVHKRVDAKFVFLVRDPIDTVASWLFNPSEFPEGADMGVEWRSGACRKTAIGEFWGFDDWRTVTTVQMALAKDYPDRVRLISYEDVISEPQEKIKKLFNWVGLDYDLQTKDFLNRSRTDHLENPRSVFKNPSRRSNLRDQLPREISDQIYDELKDNDLRRFLKPRSPGALNA